MIGGGNDQENANLIKQLDTSKVYVKIGVKDIIWLTEAEEIGSDRRWE